MDLLQRNEYDLLFNSIKKKEKEETKEDIKKYNECNKCNKCNSSDLIDKYGYFICNNCGNKCYNSITSIQEWRNYENGPQNLPPFVSEVRGRIG